MTPEQHNKYLAYAHLAYGTFTALLTMGFLALFGVFFFAISKAPAEPNAPPMGFFLVIWLFFGAMYAAFTIPSFVAGYGLLKRRRWAKVASIIGGVVAGMFFLLVPQLEQCHCPWCQIQLRQ